MKMKITQLIILLSFAILISLFSCSKDDVIPEKDDTPQLQSVSAPTQFEIIDYGNSGNATDLYFKFNRSSNENEILEYRLYLIKEGTDLPKESELEIGASNYYKITKTGKNFEESVSVTFNDYDGDPINEEGAYNAFLASISINDEKLSSLSSVDYIRLQNVPVYKVETLGNVIGAEALTLNPKTQKIYAPYRGAFLEIDVATGDYKILQDNMSEGPLGGAFDQSYENFYLSFYNTSQLKRFDGVGQWTTIATNLGGPTGITSDVNDNLYVSGYWSNEIYKITPDGTKSVYAKSNYFNGLDGLIFVGGIMYAINFDDSNIMKILADGTVTLFATLPRKNGNWTGYITYAHGYFFAANGPNLYSVDLNGKVTKVAGNDKAGVKDGPAQFSVLRGVNGIAASASGDTVFLGDVNNIRMLIKQD